MLVVEDSSIDWIDSVIIDKLVMVGWINFKDIIEYFINSSFVTFLNYIKGLIVIVSN